MTPHERRSLRLINQQIDAELKRGGLRPMAEAWPPDPVKIGPFGITAERWVEIVIGLALVGALGMTVWFSEW